MGIARDGVRDEAMFEEVRGQHNAQEGVEFSGQGTGQRQPAKGEPCQADGERAKDADLAYLPQ